MKRLIPYLAVVTAMLIWAGAGIAVKEALVVFSPLTLIVLRFTLAVLIMLAVGLSFRRNEILGLQVVAKRDIPLFLLGGLFQPFLYFIFETYTYQSFASPTIAEAMLSTQPVFAPIFAFFLLRERVTRNNILGIILSTIGMLLLLLVGSDDFSHPLKGTAFSNIYQHCGGVLYTLSAAVRNEKINERRKIYAPSDCGGKAWLETGGSSYRGGDCLRG